MKKHFFRNAAGKVLARAAFTLKAHGPMNYVGHPLYDEDRRHNRHKFLTLAHVHDRFAFNMVEPKVLHGGLVEVVDRPTVGFGSLKCDALLTERKGLLLTMTGADCPTLYLVDPASEIIGLVHCGWRPISVGVIENTIERAVHEFNVVPSGLLALIGPGICARCFEIGPDVASIFGVHSDENSLNNGKILFSLNEEILKRLLSVGLDKKNIQMSGECTKCSEGGVKYYSWRRDRSDPLDAQMALLALR